MVTLFCKWTQCVCEAVTTTTRGVAERAVAERHLQARHVLVAGDRLEQLLQVASTVPGKKGSRVHEKRRQVI